MVIRHELDFPCAKSILSRPLREAATMYQFDQRLVALNPTWEVLSRADRTSTAAQSRDCGPTHVTTVAPVDVIFTDIGIRLRHVPGEVDFTERQVTAQPVTPSPNLSREIRACLSGAPHRLTILKAVPVVHSEANLPCPDCGETMVVSALDFALGHNAELVVEKIHGHWCWHCYAGTIGDNVVELRRRLARWVPGGESITVPSLLYDAAAHPRSIQLEVTTRCNLSCGYCSNRLLAERRDVDFAQLLGLLDHIELEMVDQVELTGLGEGLLHPRLLDVVKAIRRRAAVTDIGMVTNGVSLMRDRVAPLIEAGLSRVSVSIDSLDPERFYRQRPGTRLEKILANVEDIARLRDENGFADFRFGIHAVVTDDPYAQAEPLIFYSAELGLELPIFTPLDAREVSLGLYGSQWPTAGRTTAGDFEAFYTWVVERWIELGGSVKVPSRMRRLDERPVTAARRREGFHHSSLEDYPSLWLCPWAIDKCFIAGDGSILSCCNAMTDIPRSALANLRHDVLRKVWADDLLWAYRLPLALDLLPAGCVGCDQGPPQGRPISLSGSSAK
jgi:MoaA/NifB/PqqE/SkfB family radical SAM enzyme